MKTLTSTRMKTARACKRQHHYEYNLGYRPAQEADTLRFGSLCHRGLEAWLLAIKAGLPVDVWLEKALEALRSGTSDPFELARAEAMLIAYHLRWSEVPLKVLAVEVQFEAALRNPDTGRTSRTWRLGGKLDAVIEDLRDNLVKVMEHKTSSEDVSPGSDYWKRLRLDGQVSTYFDGAAALGHNVASCLYDVLGKPGQKPSNVPVLDEAGVKVVLDASGQRVRTKDGKKYRETADTAQGYVLQTRPETPDEYKARVMAAIAEAPDAYLSRGEVVRLDNELDEARFDAWSLGLELQESENANRHPRNPDACVRYGRTCAFFEVCTGQASLDDPALYRRLENVHPELNEERPKEEAAQ